MRNNQGGAYLSPSYTNRKPWIIGLIVLIVAIFFAMLACRNGEDKRKIMYHLPGEAPSFSLPENLEDHSGSHVLEELVVPCYDFFLEADNTSIEVSLPIIQASYGADFNAAVVDQLEALVSNTMFYLERGEAWVVKKMSYEAYLDQNILTVLIMTETEDQTRCKPWIFDLSNGGKEITKSELVQKFLGMDYATFLWITDQYIQSDFSTTYYNQTYAIDGQDELMESYEGILRKIPCDLANATNRTVFPANGKVYLLYDLPQISDDWYTGFRTTAKVIEIDASILRYKDLVTPQEAVRDAVFNSTVHVMGATDQAHAYLVRTIFFSEPDVFIDAVSGVSEQDQAYAIESLLRYADETDLNQILAICSGCEESTVVNKIIAEIKRESYEEEKQ